MIKRNNKQIPTIIIILTITILILIDLLTKLIFTNKSYFKDNLISITYSENYGSSFGIFSNITFYSYFIIFLAIITVITIIYYRKFFLKNKYLTYSIIFFLAGIIGNTIDRVFYGLVRDFISLKYLFIFNVADFYISLAFILYLIYESSEDKSLKSL